MMLTHIISACKQTQSGHCMYVIIRHTSPVFWTDVNKKSWLFQSVQKWTRSVNCTYFYMDSSNWHMDWWTVRRKYAGQLFISFPGHSKWQRSNHPKMTILMQKLHYTLPTWIEPISPILTGTCWKQARMGHCWPPRQTLGSWSLGGAWNTTYSYTQVSCEIKVNTPLVVH